jgi:hypothetical protein
VKPGVKPRARIDREGVGPDALLRVREPRNARSGG